MRNAPSMSTRRRVIAVLAVVGVLAAGGAAWAYFTATGSGTGAAATGTLNPPTGINAGPASGTTVPVTWTASATGGGAATPQGYYVTRTPYPSGASSPGCGSSPSSLVTSTSCNDTSVPFGSYTYTVTAVYNSWSSTSAASSEVTVVGNAPSASAPGVSATVEYGTSPYWVNKENVTLADMPSTNGGSPITSVAYYYCSTSSAPCTSANWTPIGSTSVSGAWAVTWTNASLPTDGTYDVVAVATDASSLTSATSSATEVGIDTTPPVTTNNTGSIGNAWKNTTQTVTLSPTDAGSGVPQTYYTTDGSTPSEIGGVPQGTTKTGTSILLNTSGQYTIKYFSVDNVGNAEAVKTAGTVIRIDLIAPVVPVPTVNGH
jgi:Chitobiase/beta-hexosaminidase C-terminal domain